MSLQPCDAYRIPEETTRVARAIFPDGHLVMGLYDELGLLFHDRDFADLFPIQGQPAEAPLRLALVTLLQFMEGLTDRQAAAAVRSRIDWKYLLCLELTDPGFDHTVLSEFRTRLLAHGAERRIFDAILAHAHERGWVKAGGRQRSDSTPVLGAMHVLSRIEVAAQTLRHALNVLAIIAPHWLRSQAPPEWAERYAARPSEYRLPKGDIKRIAWAEQTGADGIRLLTALYANSTPPDLRSLPAVETLRQVWVQNFMVQDGRVEWRENNNAPPSGRYIG
jgi:transposase